MVEVKIDPDKCDGCGTCVDTCPVGVFEVKEGKSTVSNADCFACMVCVVNCPNNVIEVIE